MSKEWTHKIKESEVTPPENGWNKIAASLDDSLNGLQFPVKMYNQEITPPFDTWNKIQSALDAGESPVIPIQKARSIPR